MFQDQGIVPEDILIDILLRLQVKSLVRLRCVCKSWCSLIDDVNFIKIHHRLHYSICKADEDIPFLCDGPVADITIQQLRVSLLSKHTGEVPLDLTPNLLVDVAPSLTNTPHLFDKGIMIGAVEGVVCIFWEHYKDFGLWNPATREFKALTPWLSAPYQVFAPKLIGFGFDCISNDFKVLRGYWCEDGTSCYEVNSLSTKSWKRIREPMPSVCTSKIEMGAYLDGVCYWVTCPDSPTSTPLTWPVVPTTPLILAFNCSTEVFEVFNPPQDAIVTEIGYEYCCKVTVYKERLAFIVHRIDLRKEECHFDVWVVTKVHGHSGTPLLWQHLFTFGPFPASDGIFFDIFRMDGDVLIDIKYPCLCHKGFTAHKRPESSVYNPSTGTFKNMGFFMYEFFPYVESLFPLSK